MVVLYSPQTVVCPNCNAQAGKPCTVPAESSRREVTWFHYSRITKAERGEHKHDIRHITPHPDLPHRVVEKCRDCLLVIAVRNDKKGTRTEIGEDEQWKWAYF